jgi:hypothetical protein
MLSEIGRIGREHIESLCASLTTAEREQLGELLQKIAIEQGLSPGVHPGYRRMRPGTKEGLIIRSLLMRIALDITGRRTDHVKNVFPRSDRRDTWVKNGESEAATQDRRPNSPLTHNWFCSVPGHYFKG